MFVKGSTIDRDSKRSCFGWLVKEKVNGRPQS